MRARVSRSHSANESQILRGLRLQWRLVVLAFLGVYRNGLTTRYDDVDNLPFRAPTISLPLHSLCYVRLGAPASSAISANKALSTSSGRQEMAYGSCLAEARTAVEDES
jgi:hypothetical protein